MYLKKKSLYRVTIFFGNLSNKIKEQFQLQITFHYRYVGAYVTVMAYCVIHWSTCTHIHALTCRSRYNDIVPLRPLWISLVLPFESLPVHSKHQDTYSWGTPALFLTYFFGLSSVIVTTRYLYIIFWCLASEKCTNILDAHNKHLRTA